MTVYQKGTRLHDYDEVLDDARTQYNDFIGTVAVDQADRISATQILKDCGLSPEEYRFAGIQVCPGLQGVEGATRQASIKVLALRKDEVGQSSNEVETYGKNCTYNEPMPVYAFETGLALEDLMRYTKSFEVLVKLNGLENVPFGVKYVTAEH